jgi:hypothetical protein
MNKLPLILGLLLITSAVAAKPLSESPAIGSGCSQTAKCPLDDEISVLVDEQEANGHVVGVYEHYVLGGGHHRFSARCQ